MQNNRGDHVNAILLVTQIRQRWRVSYGFRVPSEKSETTMQRNAFEVCVAGRAAVGQVVVRRAKRYATVHLNTMTRTTAFSDARAQHQRRRLTVVRAPKHKTIQHRVKGLSISAVRAIHFVNIVSQPTVFYIAVSVTNVAAAATVATVFDAATAAAVIVVVVITATNVVDVTTVIEKKVFVAIVCRSSDLFVH